MPSVVRAFSGKTGILSPLSDTARGDAPFDESPLHRISREMLGGVKVFAGYLGPSASQLELSESRRIEGVVSKALNPGDGADLFETALGTLVLGNGDGAVEGNYRRRTNREQRVVERHDTFPVRVLGTERARGYRSDRGPNVILGQLRASG